MSEYKSYTVEFKGNRRTSKVTFKLSKEDGLELHDYLKPIVHMWARGKEIEPLKCKLKPSDLSNLQNTLDSIDARLSRIEGQLTDVQETVAKTE